MNGAEHYEQAEKLMADYPTSASILALAQVHATLALTAATVDYAGVPGRYGSSWDKVTKAQGDQA